MWVSLYPVGTGIRTLRDGHNLERKCSNDRKKRPHRKQPRIYWTHSFSRTRTSNILCHRITTHTMLRSGQCMRPTKIRKIHINDCPVIRVLGVRSHVDVEQTPSIRIQNMPPKDFLPYNVALLFTHPLHDEIGPATSTQAPTNSSIR